MTTQPTQQTPATHGTELPPQGMTTFAKLRDVQQKIKTLKELEETYKSELRSELGIGIYLIGGEKVLSIGAQRKFSSEQALLVLTPEEIEKCTVTVLDRVAVQQLISPDRYSACQVDQGKPVVKAA